jgi:flagellar biosynthesis protein FlhG
MISGKHTRTISITSGKGGVGKTTLTANLALTFAQAGQKVLVFDGDFGMANVDIFFGVKARGSLHDVINGQKNINEILTELYPNIYLISGGSGVTDYNQMSALQRKSMMESLSQLPHRFDIVLIDTAPGIADHVLHLNASSDEISVILTPDPSSLADSYALIKVLHQKFRRSRFSIICNQVRDEVEGKQLFLRFQDVCDRFLSVLLEYNGSVPFDATVKKASQQQKLFMRQESATISTKATQQVANVMLQKVSRIEANSGLQMFWEQVVGTA